jgi:hypothetical protein
VSTLEQAHAYLADRQSGRIPPVHCNDAIVLHCNVQPATYQPRLMSAIIANVHLGMPKAGTYTCML